MDNLVDDDLTTETFLIVYYDDCSVLFDGVK